MSEKDNERKRRWYKANREALLTKRRDHYWEHRERILAKCRADYARKVGVE